MKEILWVCFQTGVIALFTFGLAAVPQTPAIYGPVLFATWCLGTMNGYGARKAEEAEKLKQVPQEAQQIHDGNTKPSPVYRC